MRIAVFVGTRAELIGMASFLKEVDKNPDTELVFSSYRATFRPRNV